MTQAEQPQVLKQRAIVVSDIDAITARASDREVHADACQGWQDGEPGAD